jgi:hypothetical protein
VQHVGGNGRTRRSGCCHDGGGQRGIEEGGASGGLGLELLPGGNGEGLLTLDGEEELFAAAELLVVFQLGEGGGDPGANGALGDTKLAGDGGGAQALAVEGEGLLAQGDGMGNVGGMRRLGSGI